MLRAAAAVALLALAAPAAADDAVAAALEAYRAEATDRTAAALTAALDAAEAAGVADRDFALGNLEIARAAGAAEDWATTAQRAKRAMDAFAALGAEDDALLLAESELLLASALWRYGQDEPVFALARNALFRLPEENNKPDDPLFHQAHVWLALSSAAMRMDDPEELAAFEQALLLRWTPLPIHTRDVEGRPCLNVFANRQRPRYPHAMLHRKNSGEVMISYDIGLDGELLNVTAESDSDPAFKEEVLRVVDRWRYSVVDERPECREGYRYGFEFVLER